MAIREVDALADAITDTSKEIAASAWDREDEVVLDETGDRTVETMGEGLEGQHEDDEPESEEEEGEESEGEVEEPEGEGETKDAKTEGDKPKAEADKAEPKPEGKVPPGRLREQTERAKAAETQLAARNAEIEAERANTRRELDALKAQNAAILAVLQRQQAPTDKPADPAKDESLPDLFENPKEFVDRLKRDFNQQLGEVRNDVERRYVESSLKRAHGLHGDTFVAAYEAMGRLDPRNPAELELGRSIMRDPDPGEALVAWHKRNETLRKVGDDPAKFEEQIRQSTREALMKDPEFRKQLLADLRAEASAGDDGKPRTVTRLPKSLNGTPGGTSAHTDTSMFDDSDQAIADSAWR